MAAARDVIDLTIVTMGTNKTPRGFADWKEQIMKLIICTKFHVNPMNFVESRRGVGPIDPPPPIKCSCNHFFFTASRVNNSILSPALRYNGALHSST